MKSGRIRIGYDLILFLSVIFAPWWASIFLIILGCGIFQNYIEAIGAGMMIDFLFSVPGSGFLGLPYTMTLIGLACYLVAQSMKSRLRFTKDYV